MTIGRDLVQIGIENSFQYLFMPVFFSAWAYISWYSSRLVASEKSRVNNSDEFKWFPRGLSYICYTVGITIMLLMPILKISYQAISIFIIADIVIFFMFQRISKHLKSLAPIVNSWFSWPIFIMLVLASSSIVFALYPRDYEVLIYSLAAILFVHQLFALLHVILRRENDNSYSAPLVISNLFAKFKKPLDFLNIKQKELNYFITFNLLGAFVFGIYLYAILFISGAQQLGGFNIVFLCFGVMIGAGNMLSFLSVKFSLNLHIVLIALAAGIGQIGEDPYNIRIHKKELSDRTFSKRQNLQQFTKNWLTQRINQYDSLEPVRMIFVLSDGGASRSGFWATSVLSKIIENDTQNKFKRDLFCLAGASGGGVGNSTFFSFLDDVHNGARTFDSVQITNQQMRYDFLSPTIGRLLSTDYFRHVFPLNLLRMSDRAGILEESMEQTGTGLMNKPMSKLVTYQKDELYPLPLLYINTTRMQDAQPAVVSNILLEKHSKRADVLSLLDPSKHDTEKYDMNQSTAAVLGSRFPYVSPAGVIKNNYFVDGGYFDNSGAGIAHETMLFIDQFKKKVELDTILNGRKIEYLVIHIQNNPSDSNSLKSVHPLVNDLATPIKTLAGSYSQQTSVNDSRLYNYLYEQDSTIHTDVEQWIRSSESQVYKINLYDAEACVKEKLPMSWAISKLKANIMSTNCLNGNVRLDSLIDRINNK